jgi:hypothetical protein
MALGALAFAGSAEAQETDRRLTLRRGRLFIGATINGVATVALLDTAAELTLVDRDFASRIGLSGGQGVEARGSGAGAQAATLVEGVAIKAAGVANNQATVAIVDLSDVSRRLNGAAITIILGRDYFELARFAVDLSRPSFRAMQTGDAPRGQHIVLQDEFGVLTMPASVEGQSARAAVDLGNGTLPLISRDFATRIGALSDGRSLGLDRGGGIGGAADRQTFRLSTLYVGWRTFRNVRVAVDAGRNASDLNFGTSILRDFRITLDFAQKQMWLDQAH